MPRTRFNREIHIPSPEDHASLNEMAHRVRRMHEKLKETSRPELDQQLALGSMIHAAKLSLVPGAFEWWIENYCDMSSRTGRRYLRKLKDHMVYGQGFKWSLWVKDLKDLGKSVGKRAAAARKKR